MYTIHPFTSGIARKRGFALLVTIVLVALLVLILVGLATFTRVETQVADNSELQTKARQNALAGLNMALGQLQRHAGPDQRITARADINPANSANPYYTGVWDSTNLVTWLVSGNETNALTNNASTDISANTSAVLLVNAAAGGAAGNRVRALKQPLQSNNVPGLPGAQTVGNFAYWVGDEGIKASVSQVARNASVGYDDGTNASYSTNGNQRDRLRQLGLVRPVVDRGFAAGSLDGDTTNSAIDLDRLTHLTQLTVVRATTAIPVADQRARFHDFTPLARGVLADTTVANGRLRRDWSDVAATGPTNSGMQTVLTGQFPTGTNHALVAPTGTAWPIAAVAPVVTEAGIQFGVDGSNKLQYRIVAELWNPYASRINVAANTLRVAVQLPAFNITLNNAGAPVETVNVPAQTYSAVVDARVWQPGEVVLLNGGATLTAGSVTYAALTPTNTAVAFTDVSYDAITPTAIRLEDPAGSTIWQNFTGLPNFTAAANISIPGPTQVGVGFEFVRSLAFFSDGSVANSRDPRLTAQSSNYFEPEATSNWRQAMASNTGLPGGGVFTDGQIRILFDVPSQQVTNLAQLRHAIGAGASDKPYALGSSWGAAAVNDEFDKSFVSGFPRTASPAISSATVLANPYLEIFIPEAGAPTLAQLRGENTAARYLMTRGAFNVNSTSIEAWKAVLGSRVPNWSFDVLASAKTASLTAAFYRTPHGAQNIGYLDAGNSVVPVISTAGQAAPGVRLLSAVGRNLTDSGAGNEVDRLAREIVNQIQTNTGAGRAAGEPFRSLSQFVRSGAIQAAINAAGVNSGIGNADYATSSSAALMQADVIAAIAQFMSVRSDTFMIRAYGDVVNPVTGAANPDARAWCEAVVQRIPDLASSGTATIGDVMDPPAAETFGRRFKIVSFRWLSPEDI